MMPREIAPIMCHEEGDRLWLRLRLLQEQYCLWTDQNEYDLGSDNINLRPRPTTYTPSDISDLSEQVATWQEWVNRAMTQ
jgi:hypothetical protein